MEENNERKNVSNLNYSCVSENKIKKYLFFSFSLRRQKTHIGLLTKRKRI